MKKMKFYIQIIALTISFNCFTQENPFEGTWEWQDGNQIFRVFLGYENASEKQRHFEMVQVDANGVESIIYTSYKPVNSASSIYWHPVIYASWQGNEKLSGRILDNSLNYEDPQWNGYVLWEAWLDMKILTDGNCLGCTMTASWKVKWYDIVPENRLPLNIPTDIILTKVN